MGTVGGFIRDFGRGVVRGVVTLLVFGLVLGAFVFSMAIDMKGGTIPIPVSSGSFR